MSSSASSPARAGQGATRGAAPDAARDAAAQERTRAPWTLQRRLVLTVVAVLAIISTIIAVVSVLILWASLMQRVDKQLESTITRGSVAIGLPPTAHTDPLQQASDILNAPGQAVGTLAAVIADGTVQAAGYLTADGTILRVPKGSALADVPVDGHPHTVDLGGRAGEYRLVALPSTFDATVVIGVPLASTNATVAQLAVTIALVAIIGIIAVGLLGSWIVRLALRPLTRVTETARRVAKLPLSHGEVALAERVPAEDADERTEVGQVGSALNTMLDHVGGALEARQRSEQKVRQFVADASHELRTPLASIRGYSELTRRSGQKIAPDIAHALGRIESESVRMTGLVEDLLLLARLDEGRELAHEPVDLTALVVDAVGDAHASGPDHTWDLQLPDEPATVLGDAPRLQQVIVNLLANARVHTPAGTHVTTSLVDAPDAVTITVSDDGPGIDPSVTETLFERFARADTSRARTAGSAASGSTGLGLAIVRAVVEAHGGTVTVESAPGATAFTVTLPKGALEKSEPPAVAESADASAGDPSAEDPSADDSADADDASAAEPALPTEIR
jgi:two-component system OmpR family sensor kinase